MNEADALERHAADRTRARARRSHLGVHRAGVANRRVTNAAGAHGNRDRADHRGGRRDQQQDAQPDDERARSDGVIAAGSPLAPLSLVVGRHRSLVGPGYLVTRYGRMNSLSSWSRMWQCHTYCPLRSNLATNRVISPG